MCIQCHIFVHLNHPINICTGNKIVYIERVLGLNEAQIGLQLPYIWISIYIYSSLCALKWQITISDNSIIGHCNCSQYLNVIFYPCVTIIDISPFEWIFCTELSTKMHFVAVQAMIYSDFNGLSNSLEAYVAAVVELLTAAVRDLGLGALRRSSV